MVWQQQIDPLHSPVLSTLVSLLPIVVLFYALAFRRMKGHLSILVALLTGLLVAVFALRMPGDLALWSLVGGVCYGLFPIGWIVVTAVFLYELVVKAGQLDVIRRSISSVTPDHRLQILLIALGFGAFLEGAAGFGTPVAIAGATLAGLGVPPLTAAAVSLVGNAAPAAFGGLGLPLIAGGQASGLEPAAIARAVAIQLPILGFLVPFLLVTLAAGVRRAWEVWPATLGCGLGFALGMWSIASTGHPELVDIGAALGMLAGFWLVSRIWRPKQIWRFQTAEQPVSDTPLRAGTVWRAWLPFLVLTVVVAIWSVPVVKDFFDRVTLHMHLPGLFEAVRSPGGTILPAEFKFNWLNAPGTAIFISALVSAKLLGLSFREVLLVAGASLYRLRFSVATIAGMLAFSYLANYSGMSAVLGTALAGTGKLFPFLAPMLGWLGVFVTGSDTSANALFGGLQKVTADQLHIHPVHALAANTTGGGTGKIISPQSIAIATGAVGTPGEEGTLLRLVVRYSLLLLLLAMFLSGWQTALR